MFFVPVPVRYVAAIQVVLQLTLAGGSELLVNPCGMCGRDAAADCADLAGGVIGDRDVHNFSGFLERTAPCSPLRQGDRNSQLIREIRTDIEPSLPEHDRDLSG